MVDRIRWDTVSYLPFYYVFFLLLTIFNLQANILTTKDILSNLVEMLALNVNNKAEQTVLQTVFAAQTQHALQQHGNCKQSVDGFRKVKVCFLLI